MQKKTANIILQSSNNRDNKPPNEGTALATRIGITFKPKSARPTQNVVAFPFKLSLFREQPSDRKMKGISQATVSKLLLVFLFMNQREG